ncbi:MAG: uroporphyrinogen-III synthase [Porticoccaceae bacterium]|nr:uroporphyrinogen-III synthase [Porticoccaceae bacterium]
MTTRDSVDNNDSSANLAALRVLLPRPQRDTDDFVTALQSLGCQPYWLPVIDIVPCPMDTDAREAFLASVAAADHIIFVSRTAAAMTLAALKAAGTGFSTNTRIYAVGQATASVLAAEGIEVIAPAADMTSEGLLARPELVDVAGQTVVICRGETGRDKLRDVLGDRGARVIYSNLYRRRPSAGYSAEINALLGAGLVDAVVIHSGEILAALWHQLTAANRTILTGLPLLVPGERVASLARDLGCANLVVAESALSRSLVTALVGWYTQQ